MGISALTSKADGLGSLFFCLAQFVSNYYAPSVGLDFLACFQSVLILRPDSSSASPKQNAEGARVEEIRSN